MDRRHLVLAIAIVPSILAKEAYGQGEPGLGVGLELTVQEIEP